MAGVLDAFFKYAPIATRLDKVSAGEMRELHALANRAAFRSKGAAVQAVARGVEAAAWPLTCWLLCLRADEKLDRAAAATGLSRGAYLRRQWRACVRLRIPPREYLHFAFHDEARLKRAGDFLYDIENWRLVGWLNEGVDIRPLQDKVAFAELCERAGLPTPRVLAVFSRGTARLHEDPGAAGWRRDLFLKPRGAKAGAGMRRIPFDGQAYDGKPLAEVLKQAAAASTGTDLILQPAIVNDAETARFTTGALSTVRVMTGRYPDGTVAAVGAFLRMARGASVVDNISAGGLMATVDLLKGTISEANRRWDPYVLLQAHPDTGAVFAGRTLPQWPQILDLAARGHQAFPQFAFVSWDIAPTPDGPTIIEGNHHGGTVAFQELNGTPLAESPFARVALAWLKTKRAAAR